MKQKEQEHSLELRIKAAEAGIDLTTQRLKMLNGESSDKGE